MFHILEQIRPTLVWIHVRVCEVLMPLCCPCFLACVCANSSLSVIYLVWRACVSAQLSWSPREHQGEQQKRAQAKGQRHCWHELHWDISAYIRSRGNRPKSARQRCNTVKEVTKRERTDSSAGGEREQSMGRDSLNRIIMGWRYVRMWWMLGDNDYELGNTYSSYRKPIVPQWHAPHYTM